MKKSLCFIANIEFSIKAFLVDHFAAMLPVYDITVVTNTSHVGFLKDIGLDINVIPVPLERKISLLRDISALFRLYRLFRTGHFDVIHSITPKSGLLSMAAGLLAGVPVRIHTFTGQVWATRTGFGRAILKTADKIISRCATHILVDSHSQREFLITENVVSASSAVVIANGSMCGVDTDRFAPDPAARGQIRRALGIRDDDFVFLFLGRLNRDKGLADLARAFRDVSGAHAHARLIIAGPDEENMKAELSSILSSCTDRVHFIDYTDKPEHSMAASDVFCIPSYREGFGAVVIEAAGTGIPSIGNRVYGLTDAIEDGETGFLCEPRNIEELRARMEDLLGNNALLKEMGMKARLRAIRYFSKEIVIHGMLEYYAGLFGEAGNSVNGGTAA